MKLTPGIRAILSAEQLLALDGGVGAAESIVAVIEIAAKRLRTSGRLLIAIPEWCDHTMISLALKENNLATKAVDATKLLPWTPLAQAGLERGEDGLNWRLHRVDIVSAGLLT